MQHTTTSVRLPPALYAQLEKASCRLHRGKSWIIVHALESYLEKIQFTALVEEARRQSLLIAAQENKDDSQFWEDNADTTGWE